jgi:nucleoside-specific outer membrane channel protein Tsx
MTGPTVADSPSITITPAASKIDVDDFGDVDYLGILEHIWPEDLADSYPQRSSPSHRSNMHFSDAKIFLAELHAYAPRITWLEMEGWRDK